MPNDTFSNSSTPPGTTTGDFGANEILEILNEDDSQDTSQETEEAIKQEDKKKPRPTEESDDELVEGEKESDGDEKKEEEIKLVDEEEEEVDEEKLELTVPAKRRDILKKYPNLFKEFPYLERAYYREQQFSEIYPTLDDAKEAADKARVLDQFEADVLSGNPESIIRAVKETGDTKAYGKLVDNYLVTLGKVDPQAYYHVIGNIVKHTVINMAQEGRRRGDNGQPLTTAAEILYQFVFGTSDFQPPQNLVNNQPNPEEDKLKQERQEFARERFSVVQGELAERIQNTIRATIDEHIDPNKQMTDYVRKNAVNDAFREVTTLIAKDARLKNIVMRLWERAYKENFSKDSLDNIRKTYLSQAKQILPTAIKKSRNEALKGLGKRTTDDRDRSGPLPVGRSASQANSTNTPKSVPKGMKTFDFLMQD